MRLGTILGRTSQIELTAGFAGARCRSPRRFTPSAAHLVDVADNVDDFDVILALFCFCDAHLGLEVKT
jgi:hypothetical protein